MIDLTIPTMVLPLTDVQYKILKELADKEGDSVVEYAEKMITDILLSFFNTRLMAYRMDNPEPDPQQN